jgi:hypothetical protein
MKIIVFILVIIVLLALTKYLNFDRKIKEAQIKNNPWYQLDKTLNEIERKTNKNDKNSN